MVRTLSRLLVLLLAVLCATAVPAEAGERRHLHDRDPATGPDVLLVYVDDMRADDLQYMDFTRSLFESTGTTFDHAISPHPLCCPARAELMTGQYAQNNGVHHNEGPWGAYQALVAHGRTRLLPQWFHSDGYQTAYVGKYLNGYRGGHISGTDVTEALSGGVYRPYNFVSWNNGAQTPHRRKHTTDWTADRTARLITRRFTGEAPFFITTAFLAPHKMRQDGSWRPPYARAGVSVDEVPVPPRRYTSLEATDERPPSFDKPSFNEEDMSDKPSGVQGGPVDPDEVTVLHQARVLSLYAVDDGIRRIVAALESAGRYDDTVIAFTSDNGMLLGEHRRDGKDQPYQESLRVPLMLRGPGVPVATNSNVVTTVDVPRTLASLAGVEPNRTPDGIDAFTAGPDRAVLIQSGSATQPWDWRGVYTRRFTYLERYDDGTELEAYDRQSDPFELDSDPDLPAGAALADLLEQLRDCVGSECQAAS